PTTVIFTLYLHDALPICGSTIADNICCGLDYNKITMKDFARHACLAIEFMDQYCPALGVGVEPERIPDIKYLYYDQEWDKEPAKDRKSTRLNSSHQIISY